MTSNVRRGMKRELRRLRAIASACVLGGASPPSGWDWEAYRSRRNWLDRKLDNKARGDLDRIVGGPSGRAAVDLLVAVCLEGSGDHRT